ncbi:MAG: hypothetical protein V3R98_12695 [Alphaproteobacteria bacterium]
MYKRALLAGVLAAGLTAGALPATAQTDSATADQIRRAIKVWMGQNLQNPAGIYTIALDGSITVEPDGDSYRAVIPAATVTFAGEADLFFGAIEIDLTPTDNGWYGAVWRIPDNYRIVERGGRGEAVTMTIGSQSGQGVFAPEFETFMSMDATWGDLELTGPGGAGRMTIKAVTAISNSNEVSSALYDVRSHVSISNMRVWDDDGDQVFDMAGAEFTAEAGRFNMADFTAFNNEFKALIRDVQGGQNHQALLAMSETMASLLEATPTLLDSFEFAYAVEDFAVTDGGESFSIDNGSFRMAASGLEGDRSSVEIDSASDGVEIDPFPFARFVPSETQVSLALIDLPNDALVEVITSALRSSGQMGPEAAVMMSGIQLQQAIMDAGSAIEIRAIRVIADIATLELEGVVRPNAASSYGVTAEADMVITGIDALIAEVRDTLGDQGTVQMLTVLQAMGREGTGANGEPARIYEFRLDEAGAMLLNGTDMMPLIGDALQ